MQASVSPLFLDSQAPIKGSTAVDISVSSSGSVVVSTVPDDACTLDDARVLAVAAVEIDDNESHSTRLPVRQEFVSPRLTPIVRRVDQGHWLVVYPNARYEKLANNALIIDEASNSTRSFRIGDAVADVQVANSGSIWVGFFDEGVYSADPLSTLGCVCLALDGTVVFGYNHAPTRWMQDCDSINVVGSDEVWTLHDGHSITKIVSGEITEQWTVTRAGAMPLYRVNAVAPIGDNVLIACEYRAWDLSSQDSSGTGDQVRRGRLVHYDPLTGHLGEVSLLTPDGLLFEWVLTTQAHAAVPRRLAAARGARLVLLSDAGAFEVQPNG